MRRLLGTAVAAFVLLLAVYRPAAAQETLSFATVERPPFAFGEPLKGFSIDLMNRIAEEIGREVRYEMEPSFGEMLGKVETGTVDGAIANISITSAREQVMDFTLPIFESGIQIMVAGEAGGSVLWHLLTGDVLLAVALAVVLLFGGGMLMWAFERRSQPYFDRPAGEALFPSFWWALNLVVNGGFEERVPRSILGRIFATMLVISSLFIVSIFVAKITAAMTVSALTSTVNGLNDLDTREVGTVAGSTADEFLETRDIRRVTYPGFVELGEAFRSGEIDAVVFDGPLLKYFAARNPDLKAVILDRVFRKEDYGIALPTGSPLREPINQAILTLRENGTYNALVRKWFSGAAN